MQRLPCIVLAGPTASGKTALSISLAQRVNGSMISADSMQVYRGMDIGSAKIRPDEMCGIRHALIDVLDPSEPFDVHRFQTMAKAEMKTVWNNGQIPIIVGGTGFYIQALIRDIDFSEAAQDHRIRDRLQDEALQMGDEALHARLAAIDPASADAIHPHNRKRIIRAIEYYEQTGERISDHNAAERKKTSPYCLGYFVITDDRAALYERIDARVDQMIRDGLEEEVRRLYEAGLTAGHTSMKGLGYREWFPYFEGSITRDEVIRRIKLDTRHFAKRQLTWFRREQDVIWVDRSRLKDDTSMLDFITEKWKSIYDRAHS